MFRERLNNGELLLFDGAMGTELQKRGLRTDELPEELNINRSEVLVEIHEGYLKSGADIITANTFGANSLKYKKSRYSVKEVILGGINCCKKAIEKVGKGFIAQDIGPIGQLMEPMGNLSFDDAYGIFKEQVLIGVKGNVDLFIVETMSDIYELKAAILAIKENSNIPLIVTMTFEKNGRTLTGTDPLTYVTVVEGLGIDALGMNCSLGPSESRDILRDILKNTKIPVIIQPNAGLPQIVNGETKFLVGKEEFTVEILKLIEDGAQIVGGCCGTDSKYIKELRKALNTRKLVAREIVPKTRIASNVKTVEIGETFRIIGERINPTGKKKLKEALKTENIEYILNEAITQEELGADILDVNVGLPELDEGATMVKIVKSIQEVSNLPLQIDSSDVRAIELGCRYYNGKPLINSCNGKQESLDEILPIVKKYGGAVIGLTLDEEGIPLTCKKRVEIALKILKECEKYGIGKENLIIDALVLTASAQQKEVRETLLAVEEITKLGIRTSLGVSNVSFGLPNRKLINRTFLAMTMERGLSVAILNPLDKSMMETIEAFKVLNYEDVDASEYIDSFKDIISNKGSDSQSTNFEDYTLEEIIKRGLKSLSNDKTKDLLKEKTPFFIVNKIIIPTLDEVGKGFESGEIFLPQLIQSAETVKNAFAVLKIAIKAEGGVSKSQQGKIILATVKGDIHDIGKNIVKVLLENYGYEIIDLGKDVGSDKIIKAILDTGAGLLGLSALMTTTVKNMEVIISDIRKAGLNLPIMVGGAVLTQEYCEMIKGDFYGKDAREAVSIADKIYK